MWAVLAGTFTLRFSTGLTGAMLGVYLARLPRLGGPEVDPIVVGLFSATFFLAELILSPIFGILSDRLGHHRVMLFGPAFGAVAVILTGLTADICVLFTANDAYMRDYNLIVPGDCVASISEEENAHALRQMEKILKADVSPSSELDLKNLGVSTEHGARPRA